jgi:hypothetical protein
MRKPFIIIALLITAGVVAYHYRPQQTVEAGNTVKSGGVMLFHVTRTAVEAGMDQWHKEHK